MNNPNEYVMTMADAARLLCGDGPGASANLYTWRRRYPVLDQMSIGEGRNRRWRRADLVQFLIDLPRHRGARRGQAAQQITRGL